MTRRADRLIVHGQSLKEALVRQGLPEDKIEVVPHGDYSFFTKWRRAGLERENAILFFGRITKYKGLEYLFKAVPEIIRAFPDLKIIIAGRNGLLGLDQMAEYAKSFEIHNEYVSDRKVAELFQRAKVAVLPYTQATQSGIIMIAYAFKVPVVATSVGAIPEVVENGVTGYLVPPRDAEALAGAVIDLLGDEKKRVAMGESAYEKMKRELSWERIANDTTRVYARAVAEPEKAGQGTQ